MDDKIWTSQRGRNHLRLGCAGIGFTIYPGSDNALDMFEEISAMRQEAAAKGIASDGLTDNQLLENHWLTNVAPLLTAGSNLQHGVDRLIDFANEYNGHDNITALVVRAKIG